MITPEKLSAWRIVPRLLILCYMLVFYQTTQWFMAMPDPTNAQAGFCSIIVGAGAGWFAIYVNGTRATVSVTQKTEVKDTI